MSWRRALIFSWFALVCCGVEAHEEGPPATSTVLISLGLTAGGAVFVSLTLLAILWKPIDIAFRRSRFRARWEQRSTRIVFAVGVILLAGVIVGGATYFAIEKEEHEEHSADKGKLKPKRGGEVMKVDRFVVEMIARRTGEFRLYLDTLEGNRPGAWDVKPTITFTQGAGEGAQKTVLLMKLTPDGDHFATVAMPPQAPKIPLHLSLRVFDQTYEVDFDLPVQD